MLNKIFLMGRLTKNPELRRTQSGLAVTSFSIAVDRDFKGQNGEKETDFVDIPYEIALHRQPIGRLGTPAEMAELAAFLMSREGENIVGQTVLSCGGSTI